jgi:WhiB family redox-sensing transcriptional regulator
MFDTTDAACATADPEIFFPEQGKGNKHEQVRQAKAICAGCPIAMQCLAEAIAENHDGIWGGTTVNERKMMKRTRPLNIPRRSR